MLNTEIGSVITLTPAQALFLQRSIPNFDAKSWHTSLAGKAASDRYFVRIAAPGNQESFVMVVWDRSDNDWDRFIAINNDCRSSAPFLPPIFAVDENHGLILEHDCGAQTLKTFIINADHNRVVDAYQQSIDALISWQNIPLHQCAVLQSRTMDTEMFLWESSYFATHCVTEFFGLEGLLSEEWEHDRKQLAAEVAALPTVCIHRDFQSENIMIQDKKIWFVDYQGARGGPAGYDLASLLYDPYVAVLEAPLVGQLIDYYRSSSPHTINNRHLQICSIQRLMQALGAYCNLSIHKRKEWYKAYIPVALHRLAQQLALIDDFKAIRMVVEKCAVQTGL